jgi:hypothetical protein
MDVIPDDASIQVLMESRAEPIARTFDALSGAHRAIVQALRLANRRR